MLEITYKKCIKCLEIKAIDCFHIQKKNKDGYRKDCKNCRSNHSKAYHLLTREKAIKRHSEWYSNNKDKAIEWVKKYRKTEIGKSVYTASNQRRRFKIQNGDISSTQILNLTQQTKKCYWCNTSLKNIKIHIDHYIPLSKGGEHILSNLVVSCQKCNNKKYSKDPIQFANSIGKLL